MLDLLAGEPTERTRLAMVREKPLPFPPEPLCLGRHPAHHALAGPPRPHRQAEPLAAHAGPARARVRLVTDPIGAGPAPLRDVHAAAGRGRRRARPPSTPRRSSCTLDGSHEVGLWEAGPGRDVDVEVDEVFLVLVAPEP